MSDRTAVINGTGMAVPQRVLTNRDLEAMVDTSDEWIVTRTGIRERRVAEPDDSLSRYCVDASRRALDAAGISPADVGLVVLATVTPDMPIPATACTVQHELGCTNAAAFDLAAGCSGFIYAQEVARQFVEGGTVRHALVIGAELLSKYVDWTDRATCVLFADGAGAVLLGAGRPPRGILAQTIKSDGSMSDFIYMPGGGSVHPPGQAMVDERLHYIRMRGNETFKTAVRSIEEVCREVLDTAGLTADDVNCFVPHQANRRIIDAVGQRLGIPAERSVVNIERYGNTSSASIPIALDEAVRDGRVQSGDIVLMAAFGAGLTWGATLLRW